MDYIASFVLVRDFQFIAAVDHIGLETVQLDDTLIQ